MREPEGRADVQRPMRRLNPTLIALLAGLVVLLLLFAYFASSRDPDQDKLKDPQLTSTRAETSPEKRCASQATYDLIKRISSGAPPRCAAATRLPTTSSRPTPRSAWKTGSRVGKRRDRRSQLLGLAIARSSARRRGSRRQANALRRCGLHLTAGRGRQRQRRIAAKRGSHCYSARDAYACSATSSARGRAAARPRQPRSADGQRTTGRPNCAGDAGASCAAAGRSPPELRLRQRSNEGRGRRLLRRGPGDPGSDDGRTIRPRHGGGIA